MQGHELAISHLMMVLCCLKTLSIWSWSASVQQYHLLREEYLSPSTAMGKKGLVARKS